MSYSVYITERVKKEMLKLSQNDNEILQKIFLHLNENPYSGDMIRYKFFREKRMSEKRIYFLVYDEVSAVLIVAIGGKKTQQETINHIIQDFPLYREYINNIIKREI